VNDILILNSWYTWPRRANEITFAKPIQFLILRIVLTPLRSKPTSYTLAISTPIPPSTDLHALIIKELSLHKKPESFAQFLVYRLSGINLESCEIIQVDSLGTMSVM